MKLDDRDIRQIRKMLGRIEQFERGDIPLSRLVFDLEALASQLSGISEQWRNAFLSGWGALDEVQAVIVNEARTHLENKDKLVIDRALAKLKPLIKELL